MEEKKDFKPQATVDVVVSGPLKISGNFILKDIRRNTEETLTEVYLCRCGRSADKPRCDGSHKR